MRVCAIYEPPQTSTRDSIALQPDPRAELLDEIAARLGLRRVGWIFTDLLPDDLNKGTVKHIRYLYTLYYDTNTYMWEWNIVKYKWNKMHLMRCNMMT